MNEITFDYFYGGESEQFSYYRIPRLLVTGPQFRKLSTDAKLLYGLMLDRMGLSAKNGWYDEKSKVFIYYAMSEIQCDLNCGHDKAIKMLAELDCGKGIGLIERVKQGQGKPARIYVKRFVTTAIPPKPEPEPQAASRVPEGRSQDFDFPEVQTSDFPKSRSREIRSADIGKTDPNYNMLTVMRRCPFGHEVRAEQVQEQRPGQCFPHEHQQQCADKQRKCSLKQHREKAHFSVLLAYKVYCFSAFLHKYYLISQKSCQIL